MYMYRGLSIHDLATPAESRSGGAKSATHRRYTTGHSRPSGLGHNKHAGTRREKQENNHRKQPSGASGFRLRHYEKSVNTA